MLCVTGSCELLFGLWELNKSPLEEQPVLSAIEPSMQPQNPTLDSHENLIVELYVLELILFSGLVSQLIDSFSDISKTYRYPNIGEINRGIGREKEIEAEYGGTCL